MNRITVIGEKRIEELTDLLVEENKIIVDQEQELYLSFDHTKQNVVIHLNPYSKLQLVIESIASEVTLCYQGMEQSELTVDHFAYEEEGSIEVTLEECAKVNYFFRSINEEKHSMKETIQHRGKQSESYFQNHVVNKEENAFTLSVDGIIPKGVTDCICNQDNKIINLKNGRSTILPNLLIEEYQVEANHSAYIGEFKEEELFYLLSRGIRKEESYRLLLEGFLMGKRKEEKLRENYLSYLR